MAKHRGKKSDKKTAKRGRHGAARCAACRKRRAKTCRHGSMRRMSLTEGRKVYATVERIKRASKKSKTKHRGTSSGRATGIERVVNRAVRAGASRFLVIKVKDWRGYPGPAFTYLGSSPTKEGASVVVKKGGRAGLHALYDTKTKKAWKAYVAKVHTFSY